MVEIQSATDLKAAICGMTLVEETNQGFEVTLPQIYHDGTAVVVIVRPESGGFFIHDNSYAAMLVASMGVRFSKPFREMVAEQVEAYGCQFDQMRIQRRVADDATVAVAATLVGCASRLVADYALRASKPPITDFRAALAGSVLAAVGSKRVRTNEEVKGHLGSHYRVSTVVLDQHETRPIAFVEPIADKESVPRRFKEFYDISRTPTYSGIDLVAVYQDGSAVSSGDALLLQEVGNLVRYADAPARFAEWVTA